MINVSSLLPSTTPSKLTDSFPSNAPKNNIPPYGKRQGWIPRKPEDFEDGGAFPEIHVAQYPLDMGKKQNFSKQGKTLPVTLDSKGRVNYDVVVHPGGKKMVQTRHEDLVAKRFEDEDLKRPDPEEEALVTQKTKEALERQVNLKIAAAQPSGPTNDSNGPTFIRYTPSQKGEGHNSGATQRIIRLTEMPSDPLEPPKFKHKKVPRGPPSPPAPVMHSPPRKVTAKDQQDWKIPPCISNWKNNKGYTIPLDKRLAADGRGLVEFTINDNFSKLSEALYIAERNAREEVTRRAEVEKRLKLKEKEKKEETLRKLAQEARVERAKAMESIPQDDEEATSRIEREKIREERRRERERELRISRNKSAAARNMDRDISERIALGMAVPEQSGEVLYDQRLFNQTKGMDSGFGDDEAYNIYSKPLFHGSSATQIYKAPKKDADTDVYGSEEDYKKLLDTSKFKPDKDFSGVERDKKAEPRSGPVEFEKEEDPFGLDEFLSEAKKSGSKPLDKIGSRGHMHAATSTSTSGKDASSSLKRGRIDFEPKSSRSRSDRDSERSKRHRR